MGEDSAVVSDGDDLWTIGSSEYLLSVHTALGDLWTSGRRGTEVGDGEPDVRVVETVVLYGSWYTASARAYFCVCGWCPVWVSRVVTACWVSVEGVFGARSETHVDNIVGCVAHWVSGPIEAEAPVSGRTADDEFGIAGRGDTILLIRL